MQFQMELTLLAGILRGSETLQSACRAMASEALRHTTNTAALSVVQDQFTNLANIFARLKADASAPKSFWDRLGVETEHWQLSLPPREESVWNDILDGGIFSGQSPIWASLSDPIGGVFLFTGTELGQSEPIILGMRQLWQDYNYYTPLNAELSLIYMREREGCHRERVIIRGWRDRLEHHSPNSDVIKQLEEIQFVRGSSKSSEEVMTLDRIALATTIRKKEKSETTSEEFYFRGTPHISELTTQYPLTVLSDLSEDIDLGIKEEEIS